MKKYYTYHWAIGFIVISLICIIPLTFFYNFKKENKLSKIKVHEHFVLELQKTAMEKRVDAVIDDLLLLSEHVKLASNSDNQHQYTEKELIILEQEFRAFCIGKHKKFDQLRLLNSEGQEIIRINFNQKEANIVDKADLQNKSSRYYFKALAKLNPDEIYVSPLDLNIEHGEIDIPYKPMIRLGAPLFDNSGNFRGAVIINYLGDGILNSFKSLGEQSIGDNLMLNENGDWLKNTVDTSLEWNFMFEDLINDNFMHSFSSAWNIINSNEKGQIEDNSGLFTYHTVFPLPNENFEYIPSDGTLRIMKIVGKGDSFWKIITHINKSELTSLISPLNKERNIIIVCILILSALLSTIISNIRINEIQAKNNLKDLNLKLEDKVKEKTAEYLKAKEKAEESNRLKTAFLNNMSHEIRTPLNGMLGFTGLLAENNHYTPEKVKQFARIINTRGHGLLNLIEDILDISKIESGQLRFHEVQCVLYEEFKELDEFFDNYKKQVNKSNIEIVFDIQYELLKERMLLDSTRLKQIIINLISNALKFSEQGKIELKCDMDTSGLLNFSISDNGIGIPLEKQSVIFDRFVQSDSEISTRFGGTGLGLSIVKGILDLLGGKIWVESKLGEGSTFYFTFPYKTVSDTTKIEEETTLADNELEKNKVSKILIVEDDMFNIEYLKEIFSQTPYEITISETGCDALEKIETNCFNIILMDIKLPDINGLEVTKIIRKKNKNVKIIAQTAFASEIDRKIAIDSGCDDFISKPIKHKSLLNLIENLTAV